MKPSTPVRLLDPPSKKILLVTPDFPPHIIGGGALVCQELAKEYVRSGWDVTVVSMDTSRSGLFSRPERSEDADPRVIFLPVTARMETSGVSFLLLLPPSLPGLVRLAREIRREHWEAIHLHGNPSILVDTAGFLCRLRSVPYVLTFHGAMSEPGRLGGFIRFVYRGWTAIERRLFSGAVAITAVSETTLHEVRRLGFRARRMETVPNARIVPAPRPERPDRAEGGELGRFGLEEGNFVLCLGAFIPRKGQDLLLRAFSQLVDQRALPDDLLLVLAGFERDRVYSERLREIVAYTPIQSRVRFLGEVSNSEKETLMRAARWVVLPSRYEASPVVAFEALAQGCVLVAPDLPNFREVVGEEPTTVTFRRGNVESLAQAMKELASDPGREPAIRAAALERARKLPTWSEVARAYLALFPTERSDRVTREASESRYAS